MLQNWRWSLVAQAFECVSELNVTQPFPPPLAAIAGELRREAPKREARRRAGLPAADGQAYRLRALRYGVSRRGSPEIRRAEAERPALQEAAVYPGVAIRSS
jgi:hypothetical protein